MPYIKQIDRDRIDTGGKAETPGELNYTITMAVNSYLHEKGLSYTNINEVVGVSEEIRRKSGGNRGQTTVFNGF